MIILAHVSDLHVGSVVALSPNKLILDDGQEYRPGKVSRWASRDYLSLAVGAPRAKAGAGEARATIAERLPHLATMAAPGLTAAYVCHNRACKAPALTEEALSGVLPVLRLPGPTSRAGSVRAK